LRFERSTIDGVELVQADPIKDHRGFFARTFCEAEFSEFGLNPRFVQCNLSYNAVKGTLRGLHFQKAPKEETKLIRCIAGAIYDVVLDIRPQSKSFGKWEAFELTKENLLSLYIPAGIAHGFQTLQDETEVFYQMSEYYSPVHAAGIRWDDEAFTIAWPISSPVVSAKDQSYPGFAG
jgi:dTDP-4-dehydrorhamnose 3,5-epimerase